VGLCYEFLYEIQTHCIAQCTVATDAAERASVLRNRARLPLAGLAAVAVILVGLASYRLWASSASSSPSPLMPSSVSSPSPSQFSLTVVNIDGPPVDVRVNQVVVRNVVCHAGANPAMTPNASFPLPWTVTVTKADGSVLGTWTETGNEGARKIEIRADSVDEVAAELGGGGPPPGPTCAP
jgi:hypothetical protein